MSSFWTGFIWMQLFGMMTDSKLFQKKKRLSKLKLEGGRREHVKSLDWTKAYYAIIRCDDRQQMVPEKDVFSPLRSEPEDAPKEHYGEWR